MHYQIIRLAKGGQGISYQNGKTFFVEGALPGESGNAVVIDEKKSFGRCRPDSRDNDSPFRLLSDNCPASQICDGCGFRHVRPEFALQLKAQAVHAEILKSSHLSNIPFHLAPLPDLSLDNTRHRLRLHAANGQLGFFARGTHTVIKADKCAVITPNLRNAVAWLQNNLPVSKIPFDIQLDQDSTSAVFANLRIPQSRILKKYQHRPGARKNEKTTANQSLEFMYDFAQSAVKSGQFDGFRIENQTFGNAWIKDIVNLNGIQTVSWRRIGDFGQATPSANKLLHNLLDEFLADNNYMHAVDLYAGSGNLSFRAAVRVPLIDAFEFFCDEQAFSKGINDSSHAWPLNTVVNLHICNLDNGLPDSVLDADVLICDPPRSGLSEKLTADICRNNAKKILYISCEASCLARDITRLSSAYKPESITYVDMFPQTPLVETVAVLEKIK